MTPQEKALLAAIRFCEGTSGSPITENNGYDIIVEGVTEGRQRFDDYSDHPFAPQFNRKAVLVQLHPPIYSTAAGGYQILYRFWKVYRIMLNLRDFSPASQDAVAMQMLTEVGAPVLLAHGNVTGAIAACSSRWASLPGSPYGQPVRPMAVVLAHYQEAIGKLPATENA